MKAKREEHMKITLEFNDDEIKQAEQAFRGADYAIAAENFREFLRLTRKHGGHGEEAQIVVEEIERSFHETFQGLLDD